MQPVKPASLAIRVQCTGTVTEAALAQLEAALEAHPENVDLRFARAVMLEELSSLALARGAYKGVLARDPHHFGALMNLGTMLYVSGRIPEARILYQHATKYHPGEASASVNLATVLTETDPAAARATYEYALTIDPAHPTANYGLALLLEAQGEFEAARVYRERAFAQPIVHVAPYHGTAEPVRVLTLLGASGGNVVTTLILDDRYIQSTSLVADTYRAGMELPPHDVIFNAIGDAERSDDALEVAERIVAATHAPVINQPGAVRASVRSNVGRLGAVPNVIAPLTQLVPRAQITPAGLRARGYSFPVLLRAPGYHMGEHFSMARTPDDLATCLAAIPGAAVLVIQYLDARRSGIASKYRAFFVAGEIFPVHLARSSTQWKIHYVTSDMNVDDRYWAEERAYLTDMPATVGPQVMTALAGIVAMLGLDHGGIDFGIDADDNVLVFEANATMVIAWPPNDERAVYRRPPVQAILDATERLFRARAAAPRR